MEQALLKNLGVNAKRDIQAEELTHALALPQEYGITDHSERNIEYLLKFVQAYNQEIVPLSGEPIVNSGQATALMYPILRQLPTEEVWIALLNSKNIPIKKIKISNGEVDQTLILKKEILRTALIERASAIILYHNHPSGNPTPSQADLKQTESLRKGCDALGLHLLDHIIISNQKTYSFTEEKITNIFE